MECKAALTEAKGDIEEATTILRKRGLAAKQEVGPQHERGLIGRIHMGRQDWRPRGNELRVGLRRAHRRLPDAPEGSGAAGSGRQPDGTRAATRFRPRSSSASAASTAPRWRIGNAAAGHREDHRGQARQLYEQVVITDRHRRSQATVGQMMGRRSPSSAKHLDREIRAQVGRRRARGGYDCRVAT